MNDHEWQEVIGTIGMFVLVISVVWSLLWWLVTARRAEAHEARNAEHREFLAAALTGQRNTERQLTEIAGQMADLQVRTATIERVLKDVE